MLAKFSGLETHNGYYGNTFKIIHPDSFPGDHYTNFEHPTMVSLFNIIIHFVGDLWLDDRFNIIIFLGVVLLAMGGIDRICNFLGLDKFERVVVIAFLMVQHKLLTHIPQIVSTANFNPTTYSYPFSRK